MRVIYSSSLVSQGGCNSMAPHKPDIMSRGPACSHPTLTVRVVAARHQERVPCKGLVHESALQGTPHAVAALRHHQRLGGRPRHCGRRRGAVARAAEAVRP